MPNITSTTDHRHSPSCRVKPQGPWWYIAPRGQQIVADRPTEVPILDIRGSPCGANNWPGLDLAAEEIALEIQRDGLWPRHECDACSTLVSIEGEQVRVRAATADGLTATRFRKCSRHGCTNDLPDHRPKTRCAKVCDVPLPSFIPVFAGGACRLLSAKMSCMVVSKPILHYARLRHLPTLPPRPIHHHYVHCMSVSWWRWF